MSVMRQALPLPTQTDVHPVMRFGPGQGTAKLPESCFQVAVIEVDGKQHYGTGETASPELYGDDKARGLPT